MLSVGCGVARQVYCDWKAAFDGKFTVQDKRVNVYGCEDGACGKIYDVKPDGERCTCGKEVARQKDYHVHDVAFREGIDTAVRLARLAAAAAESEEQ
jgi:hypothetical protein